MRKINKIIIHCSATKATQDFRAADIRRWHMAPVEKGGRGWSDIGYHFVIIRHGEVENGRPLEVIGAHCQGYNADSIGVCLVGGVDENNMPESNFTDLQWQALIKLVVHLQASFPDATIHGHNEFSHKACPSFDVQAWLKAAMI